MVSRREKTRIVLDLLRERIPRPETELEYRDPFALLVAVMLSAQCTDARVNMVTPALMNRFPTPQAMAEAERDEILEYIRSISYPNSKATALAVTSRMIVEEFGGEVPGSHAELLRLRGVGRKTANVMMAVAFNEPAIAVDTHVFRVANRIGIVKNAKTPHAVEKGLHRVIEQDEWGEAHHLLILHGRYTCTARSPACSTCPITEHCDYFASLRKLPTPLSGLDPRRGKFFSQTSGRYFNEPTKRTDRNGVEQIAEPGTNSMNVFSTKTGETTKKVKDYRV